jgi:hypothetical protein
LTIRLSAKRSARTVALRGNHRFDISFNAASSYAWRWNNRTSADCHILLSELGLWLALD